MLRLCWIACLICALALGFTAKISARADDVVVRLVVPFAPGGLPDTIARIVTAQLLADGHGKFIVENRPGGAGTVAAEYVARAAADGTTLLIADAQQWAIAPQMLNSVRYDVLRDFAPVALLGTTGNVLVVGTSLGVEDFKGLIALLKANPGKYYYGTPGVGSLHHLTVEALKNRLGLQITSVPYKGGSEVIPAILANDVQLAVQAMPSVSAFAKEGKLKILAMATAKRSKLTPEIPTMEELGVPDMDFPGAIGVLAPSGTPPETISRLAAEFGAAVTAPDVIAKFASYAIEPSPHATPDALRTLIEGDIAKYKTAIETAGLAIH
jgi:tripartite-type tricarboxylate transporter receptor subunit TctC